MHASQAVCRELYDSILDFEGDAFYRQVLAPWIAAHPGEREWLRSFAARPGSPVPPAEIEDLWRLYAFSRINELLLLRFQDGDADGSKWPGPPISLDEYVTFAEAMGLTVVQPKAFSPFFHEIVAARCSADAAEPLSLVEQRWPCLMLGDLLISRAGVVVAGGSAALNPQIAETSMLYWAHRRKNRPYQDLAQGWGSNSQWRTSFRRDYRLPQGLFFNVDGKHDVNLPDPRGDDLSQDERLELLVHRCFITTAKPHEDLWPYYDQLHVPA